MFYLHNVFFVFTHLETKNVFWNLDDVSFIVPCAFITTTNTAWAIKCRKINRSEVSMARKGSQLVVCNGRSFARKVLPQTTVETPNRSFAMHAI